MKTALVLLASLVASATVAVSSAAFSDVPASFAPYFVTDSQASDMAGMDCYAGRGYEGETSYGYDGYSRWRCTPWDLGRRFFHYRVEFLRDPESGKIIIQARRRTTSYAG